MGFVNFLNLPIQDRIDWQSSESPSVNLGVRDKYNVLGGYEATFIVTESRSGKTYEKTISVEGDDFGEVRFPEGFRVIDLNVQGKSFTWKCVVRGKVVLQG